MSVPVEANSETSEAALDALARRFRAVRERSEALCRHLPVEDLVVQSMPDASPLKWHLAHTTWFFETFLLKADVASLPGAVERSEYLFNSYYEAIGEQFPRAKRGLLTRPTVEEVFAYRAAIDRAALELLRSFAGSDEERRATARTVELGLQHEQQHQELMLTDAKHLLSCNPLFPKYRERKSRSARPPAGLAGESREDWLRCPGGVASIGSDGERGFCFDNETPRHQVLLRPFAIASRLVTNGEFLEFVRDGGYRRAELWLSLGWATAREQGWNAPLYWRERDGDFEEFALDGLVPLDLDAPVAHVSYFEADAFARWKGCRLPTEAEWETLAVSVEPESSCGFVESADLRPTADGVFDWFGQVWQWTASSYSAYPGYRPWPGAVGEYNGKFMCNQYVLRGGSCATPRDHVRATYRNFFPPDARWQFSGLRLARDL